MTDRPSTTLASNTELPAPVQGYLDRVLPQGGRVPKQVRVAQAGEMWQIIETGLGRVGFYS